MAEADDTGTPFRERALEGGSNPLEQLDRLFRLTSRRTWTAVVALVVIVGAVVAWGVIAQRDVTVTAPGLLVPSGGFIEVARLESGVVGEVHVKAGERVEKGKVLATYLATATGAEAQIVAPVSGIVEEVAIVPGSTLVPGLPALTMLPEPTRTIAVALATPSVHAQIFHGEKVALGAASAPPAQYGSIVGRITRIADNPTTFARLDRLTGGNEELARGLLAAGPVYEVDVHLERDRSTTTGYRWTSDKGPNYKVPAGTLVSMTAVVGRRSIASELFR